MAPKTFPIPKDTPNSADKAAAKLLGVQGRGRSAPARTTSNGNTAVGGRSVKGGARTRGGSV